MSILSKKMKEKRKFIRLPVYHLVKFTQLSEKQGERTIAGIRDISGGGACLLTEKKIVSGSLVQIYINFPRLATPIPSLAKVTWVKWLSRSKKYQAGLQFIDIDHECQKEIIRSIENVQKAMRG